MRGRVLRDQLGEKLARAAGADFDAPLRAPSRSRSPRTKKPRQARRRPPSDERACASSADALGAGRSPARARNAIRPTSDRLRESLFNILAHAYGLPQPDDARARPFRRHRRARDRGDFARRGACALRRNRRRGPRPHPPEHRNAWPDRRHAHPAPRRDRPRPRRHHRSPSISSSATRPTERASAKKRCERGRGRLAQAGRALRSRRARRRCDHPAAGFRRSRPPRGRRQPACFSRSSAAADGAPDG